ncbi:MAG: geranylgeranylglycerol-phosphate geranylgeranyltransferase [Thermoplasmatota archaeon]
MDKSSPLYLFRPVTSLIASLSVLIGAIIGVGTDLTSHLAEMALAVAAAFLFSAGGFGLNDYLDRDSDRVNHPRRPIPAGSISPVNALRVSVILLAASIPVALLINVQAAVIICAAAVVAVAYETSLKYRGIWGNLSISTLAALTFLFGGAAVDRLLSPAFASLVAFLFILGREIIMDVEDMAGDADRETLPRHIGRKNALVVASLLILSAVGISLLPFYPLELFGVYYLLLVAAADVVFLYALYMASRRIELVRDVTKAGILVALLAFVLGAVG